jgi:hypothetical protein
MMKFYIMFYLLLIIRQNNLLPVPGSSHTQTGGIVGYFFL